MAYIGVVAYSVIIATIIFALNRRWGRFFLALLTLCGALISLVLLLVAFDSIGEICRWCLASGMAMSLLAIASIVIWSVRNLTTIPAKWTMVWCLTASTVLALGGEIWLMERNARAVPILPAKLATISRAELLDSRNALGAQEAPIKIIMFSDLLCSVCRAVHRPIADFQRAHSDRVQLIYRHRPLSWIRGHERSEAAAAASEIAATAGKFWLFVEKLYAAGESSPISQYSRILDEIGVPGGESGTNARAPEQLTKDIHLADRLGVTRTPTFVLMVDDEPPVSVNHRQLVDALKSPKARALISP